MSGRKLHFRDGDEYDPEERARLIRFISRNPFTIIAPMRWRCTVPGCDVYEVRDTGTQYVVTRRPFLGPLVGITKIGHVGHRDDGWIRAVVAVMGDVAQQVAAGKERR
jgi:hypothetical protein